MPTIKNIVTLAFELSMEGSLRWGKTSELKSLAHVLVAVSDDAGNIGIAEAPVRPTIYGETVSSVEAIIEQELKPSLLDLDVSDTQSITETLASVKNNHCAKGALDIALWDLRFQQEGKAGLTQDFAGTQKKLRCSYILGISDMDTMLAEAMKVFDAGVSVFKINIGRDSDHDTEIVSSLNQAFVGKDVILYADANELLTEENVVQRLEVLASLGIAYVEEPLPVYMLKARAHLKQNNIVPIIADDSCFTYEHLLRELEADTFDILNIKTARTGYTESLKMLEAAKSAGKGVMLGSQAGAGLCTLHCGLFASQEGVTHPSELSFPLKLKEDILAEPLSYKDGYLDVNLLQRIRLSDNFKKQLEEKLFSN